MYESSRQFHVNNKLKELSIQPSVISIKSQCLEAHSICLNAPSILSIISKYISKSVLDRTQLHPNASFVLCEWGYFSSHIGTKRLKKWAFIPSGTSPNRNLTCLCRVHSFTSMLCYKANLAHNISLQPCLEQVITFDRFFHSGVLLWEHSFY